MATTRMRAESRPSDLTFEQKRGDLLAFCASDRLGRARAMLGAEARPSLVPPAAAPAG